MSRSKRALDLAGAAAIGAFAWPAVLAGGAWARYEHGRALFTQERTGRDGQVFRIVKLRTLTAGRRPSSISRLVRRAGIDELPSLWNVLRGEMSLVGPRPFVTDVYGRLDETQRGRHRVAPGLTGWAQIRGRWSTPFSRRIQRDLWYIDHASVPLDLLILALTPAVLLAHVRVAEPPLSAVDDLGFPDEEPE